MFSWVRRWLKSEKVLMMDMMRADVVEGKVGRNDQLIITQSFYTLGIAIQIELALDKSENNKP